MTALPGQHFLLMGWIKTVYGQFKCLSLHFCVSPGVWRRRRRIMNSAERRSSRFVCQQKTVLSKLNQRMRHGRAAFLLSLTLHFLRFSQKNSDLYEQIRHIKRKWYQWVCELCSPEFFSYLKPALFTWTAVSLFILHQHILHHGFCSRPTCDIAPCSWHKFTSPHF